MSSTGPAASRPEAAESGSDRPETPASGTRAFEPKAPTQAAEPKAPTQAAEPMAATQAAEPMAATQAAEPAAATQAAEPAAATQAAADRARDPASGDAATPPTTRVPWSTVALSAAVAVAGNLALYLLAVATGTDLRAPMGEGGAIQDLPVPAVPIVSVVGVVAAAVALRVVQRLLPRRAWGVWLGLVGLGFVLSLAPMTAVPAESVPWLAAMHALVAVVVVILIGRRARSR
jgi:hypothetical protein